MDQFSFIGLSALNYIFPLQSVFQCTLYFFKLGTFILMYVMIFIYLNYNTQDNKMHYIISRCSI
jgi:hypothetical protein